MAPRDSGSPEGAREDAFVVRDPEQARLLSDPRSLRYFEPFLARERSVSEAAAEVGCALDAMVYRVRTLVAAGLLAVVGVRRRPGRPIKLYRSVADAFLVPFAATPYAELEEGLRAQGRREEERVVRILARLLRENRHDGRRIRRGADGQVHYESASEGAEPFDWQNPPVRAIPGGVVAERLSAEVVLRDDEAREMLETLYRLVLSKPAAVPGRRDAVPGRRYFVGFTLVPLPPGEGD